MRKFYFIIVLGLSIVFASCRNEANQNNGRYQVAASSSEGGSNVIIIDTWTGEVWIRRQASLSTGFFFALTIGREES